VNNTKLPSILHRFRDMDIMPQIFASDKGHYTLLPLLGVTPCEYLDKLYLSRN